MAAKSINKPESAGFVSMAFIGWAIGAPLIGWLSDLLAKRRLILIIGSAGACLTTITLLVFPNMPNIFLMSVLGTQGALSSSMILGFALARESNPPEMSGVALGLINTFAVGSGAVLQPLAGCILDLQWDGTITEGVRIYDVVHYQYALSILPIACVFSLIAAILLKEKH